jgi:GH24 family phage-related lysozyme (muramidase)
MDEAKLKAELIQDEGRKSYPYKDTCGYWTGGIGRNLSAHGASTTDIAGWQKNGIPDAVIDGWFEMDIDAAIKCAETIFPEFPTLPDNVQRCLVNMAFDLKWGLREWKNLQMCILRNDWAGAAMAIMDSRFANEAPSRCSRLAARMVKKC